MSKKMRIKFEWPHESVLKLPEGVMRILVALEGTRPGRAHFNCLETEENQSISVKRTLVWNSGKELSEIECRRVANSAIAEKSTVFKLVGLGNQLCGEERLGAERCKRCVDGKGTFEGCIALSGSSRCANCMRDNKNDCDLPTLSRDTQFHECVPHSVERLSNSVSRMSVPHVEAHFNQSQRTSPGSSSRIEATRYIGAPQTDSEIYDLTGPSPIEVKAPNNEAYFNTHQTGLPMLYGAKNRQKAALREIINTSIPSLCEQSLKRRFSEFETEKSSGPSPASAAKFAKLDTPTSSSVRYTSSSPAIWHGKPAPTMESLSNLVEGIRYTTRQNRDVAERYIISGASNWSIETWRQNEKRLDSMLEQLYDGVELMKQLANGT
jgi:uncharacterized protein DUF3716